MKDFLINNWPFIAGIIGFIAVLVALVNHSMDIYERVWRFFRGNKSVPLKDSKIVNYGDIITGNVQKPTLIHPDSPTRYYKVGLNY